MVADPRLARNPRLARDVLRSGVSRHAFATQVLTLLRQRLRFQLLLTVLSPLRRFVFFHDSTKFLVVFLPQSLHYLSRKTHSFVSSLMAVLLCAGAPGPIESDGQDEQEAKELSSHARDVEPRPNVKKR